MTGRSITYATARSWYRALRKGASEPEVRNRAPVSGLRGYLSADRNFAMNLDDLPLPQPGLWIPAVSDSPELWVPVQSRRGCPLDCSFCSTSAIEGRAIRRRSPEAVARWLEQLVSSGFHNFNFADNTFNLPPHYAKGFAGGSLREASTSTSGTSSTPNGSILSWSNYWCESVAARSVSGSKAVPTACWEA